MDSKKQICAGYPVKIKPIQYFEYHGDKRGQTLQFHQINEINVYHNHSRPPDRMNYILGGKDSCNGDSGGPLWIRKKINGQHIAFLVGIVSSGSGNKFCGMLNSPGIYVRVKSFVDWIKKNAADGYCNFKEDKPNQTKENKHHLENRRMSYYRMKWRRRRNK